MNQKKILKGYVPKEVELFFGDVAIVDALCELYASLMHPCIFSFLQ